MTYLLHPEAEQDLPQAAKFYQERGGSLLSQPFLAEFERSVRLLVRHPQLGSLWRYGKRRFVMRRFPYSLIHIGGGEELRILAVAHQSRRPGYWRGRK